MQALEMIWDRVDGKLATTQVLQTGPQYHYTLTSGLPSIPAELLNGTVPPTLGEAPQIELQHDNPLSVSQATQPEGGPVEPALTDTHNGQARAREDT